MPLYAFRCSFDTVRSREQMKRCPQCNRVETDDALVYSRADETPLVAQTNVSDEAVTRTLQSPNQPDTIRADIRATGPTTVLPAGQKQFAT